MPALCLLMPCLLPGLDLAIHVAWGWVLQLPVCSFSNAMGLTATQALFTPRTILLL